MEAVRRSHRALESLVEIMRIPGIIEGLGGRRAMNPDKLYKQFCKFCQLSGSGTGQNKRGRASGTTPSACLYHSSRK